VKNKGRTLDRRAPVSEVRRSQRSEEDGVRAYVFEREMDSSAFELLALPYRVEPFKVNHYPGFKLTKSHFEKAFQSLHVPRSCVVLRKAKATFQCADA
jgi:hypothetical protein